MAEADRRRLLERALALPIASQDDFFAGRRPPADAEPEHLRIINDTALRTKLVDSRIAEGLQSPKGPQAIASIIRIYPGFDAPGRNGKHAALAPVATRSTARAERGPAPQQRGLPSVDDLEALIARIRSVERDVSRELGAEVDDEITRLKLELATSEGETLERLFNDLGNALERKKALRSQVRFETFRRIESDTSFVPRAFLRFIAR